MLGLQYQGRDKLCFLEALPLKGKEVTAAGQGHLIELDARKEIRQKIEIRQDQKRICDLQGEPVNTCMLIEAVTVGVIIRIQAFRGTVGEVQSRQREQHVPSL